MAFQDGLWALGTLWGWCSDECRGPLGIGDCVLGGQRQNGGAGPGTVRPWAESDPILLGEAPLPSFPPGTKAQTRVWQCLRGKFPPMRLARTCQWQSATSSGSPSPASWQEGCQGSRSDERILNHIYMCMVQKGKGRGEKPLRNTERKSLTNPLEIKKKNQPQICLRCSQIAVLKSSASQSFSSSPPSNRPKKVSNFALICALVARTKQDVTAASPRRATPYLALPQLCFLNVLIASFLCHHFLFFASKLIPTQPGPGVHWAGGALRWQRAFCHLSEGHIYTCHALDLPGKQELQALGQGRAESEMTQAARCKL